MFVISLLINYFYSVFTVQPVTECKSYYFTMGKRVKGKWVYGHLRSIKFLKEKIQYVGNGRMSG